MTTRIANAAGFLGDWLDAPRRLVDSAEVDYLTLEYLAELTMSILADQRQRDPNLGFAGDFTIVLSSLCPALALQSQLKIVTNAGGMNPKSCVIQAGKILSRAGLGRLRMACVTGDDLLPRLKALQAAGCDFLHLDSGQPLSEVAEDKVHANAYLGAKPIVEALSQDAKIVVTGRVADASLTVGPALFEFGWKWDDWNRLAQATAAGHLIECGAQVTGGYSTGWAEMELSNIGYPIAEMSQGGQCTIIKPEGTGGVVNRRTVAEQLVYEIGDPQKYMTPDVVANFADMQLNETTEGVDVFGATGTAAPTDYKVSIAHRAGYTASAQLLIYGPDWREKGEACAKIVRDRLQLAGLNLRDMQWEILGASGAGGVASPPADSTARGGIPEAVLRLIVQDPRREAVHRFTQEIAPLITSGPAGLAGYTQGRGPVRPLYSYWPALVPKDIVESQIQVETRTAQEWSKLA